MPVVELIKKYCALYGEHGTHPGETEPRPYTPFAMGNHHAKAFIDGEAYFSAIRLEIDNFMESKKPGRFFYMTAWWLGLSESVDALRIGEFPGDWTYDGTLQEGFSLPPSSNARSLHHSLRVMNSLGVDVRVLGWVSPFCANQTIRDLSGGITDVNLDTLWSVSKLRQRIGSERVMLNLLAHTLGAVHCKIVVCGDEDSMRAYTSGLDPLYNRLDPPGLTKKKMEKAQEFVAQNEIHMDNVCAALNKGDLPTAISRLLGDPNAHEIKVCWPKKEWKILLEYEGSDKIESRFLKVHGKTAISIYSLDGGWHDIGVSLEGRAAGAIHDFFRDMWNEQLTRGVRNFKINGQSIASHDRGWQQLPERQAISLQADAGKQYVQVLRTIPVMNFTLGTTKRGKFLAGDFEKKYGPKGKRLKIGPTTVSIPLGAIATLMGDYERRPISFAPDGCFEFKVALKKVISRAESYIFIADQALHCMEVMDWINARMLQKPLLKVILLQGADPADPPSSYLAEAMNNHLLPNLRLDRDKRHKNVVFYEWIGSVVHSKVTIIDDIWCAIGSANCMRRSLYTDIELSLSVLEEPTPIDKLPRTGEEEVDPDFAELVQQPSFVQRFRRDLWAHYCGISLSNRSTNEIDQCTKLLWLDLALAVWNPAVWGHAYPGIHLRPEMSRQSLDPYPAPPWPFKQADYDVKEADSRRAF